MICARLAIVPARRAMRISECLRKRRMSSGMIDILADDGSSTMLAMGTSFSLSNAANTDSKRAFW